MLTSFADASAAIWLLSHSDKQRAIAEGLDRNPAGEVVKTIQDKK